MPYTSFKRTKAGIRVSKKGGGGFTAHTQSMAEAHRTAARRERFARAKRKRRGR